MKRTYEVAEQGDKRGLAEFLKRESQFLLPMVERTELAIDEVIAVMGRATLEAVLAMSAEGVAWPKQAGKARPAGSSPELCVKVRGSSSLSANVRETRSPLCQRT